MKFRRIAGNLVKIAILVAIGYGVMKWQDDRSLDDDAAAFARAACVDAVKSRYNLMNARAYKIDRNNNGYVVLVTVTLPRGNAAKATCLTNTNGGVRDVSIDER